MLKTVKGILRDGRIDLNEPPPADLACEVLVTFLAPIDPTELEVRLRTARRYGHLRYLVIECANQALTPNQRADLAAQAAGLTPLGPHWERVDRAQAAQLLRVGLTRDLAYNCDCMPDAIAANFTDEILLLAEPVFAFMTNWRVEDWEYLSIALATAERGEWPVSRATFSLAVVAVGPSATMILCVEDED